MACFSTPTPARFEVRWTAEYVPQDMCLRHVRFEADSARVERGSQEMTLHILCEIDTRLNFNTGHSGTEK